MKNKKRIGFLTVALCLLVCWMMFDAHQKHEQGKLYDQLAVCGTFGTPGMALRDMKGGTYELEIVEEDEYGRILFSFSSRNLVTEQWETALVICQASDEDYVYFYEDQCFLFAPWDESGIEQIKEKNDWCKPLNNEKMSRREVEILIGDVICDPISLYQGSVFTRYDREILGQQLALWDIQLMDNDGNGHELHYIYSENQDVSYFAIINSSYEVAQLVVQNNTFNLEEYIAFKKSCGWSYGFEEGAE